MKRVGIYLRVSTDNQTTENQRRELNAVAQRSGWQIVGTYEDAGISGAKGREQRPRLRSPAEGCYGAQGRYDRGVVCRPPREEPAGSGWLPDRVAGPALRSVPSPTGSRHHYSVQRRHVSDVRGVRRVRTRNDPGAGQRRPSKGAGEADANRDIYQSRDADGNSCLQTSCTSGTLYPQCSAIGG
jgi:hypothetical protein